MQSISVTLWKKNAKVICEGAGGGSQKEKYHLFLQLWGCSVISTFSFSENTEIAAFKSKCLSDSEPECSAQSDGMDDAWMQKDWCDLHVFDVTVNGTTS